MEDTRRILVVDDEVSIVDAVGTALRYEGYRVERPSAAARRSTRLHASTPT